MKEKYDVIIIGAGAAGMMSAIEAGKRGRKVLLVDHAKKIGEKIRISGGGRCNFTNINAHHSKFISNNPKFIISALKQYTQNDFINLIKKHNIKFHEKKLGQLFCDESAQQIIDMMLLECKSANVILKKDTKITNIDKEDNKYLIMVGSDKFLSDSLIIATGGLSIPKIGATQFGYDVAKQFGLPVTAVKPALVPLTFQDEFLHRCRALSGLSVDAEVRYGKTVFREGLLFTHRGLSGPSILQISSYWDEGQALEIDLLPDMDVTTLLKARKSESPRQDVLTALADCLPRRLAADILDELSVSGRLADLPDRLLAHTGQRINRWQVSPSGTEGYRTAEVTLGGVDVNALSSRTMEAKTQPGLFFIGEVVDVTGHLGGYNFQWAWSSGFVAGEAA